MSNTNSEVLLTRCYKGYTFTVGEDSQGNYFAFILNTAIEASGNSLKDAELNIKMLIDNLKEKK